MTHVKMIYDRNIVVGFRMEGHAGFNTNGPDIVCASLSATSQMTVNGVLDWTGLGLDDVAIKCDKKSGILHIELGEDDCSSIVVQQLFKSFEMYVEMLAEVYTKNVELERSYRNDNKNQ